MSVPAHPEGIAETVILAEKFVSFQGEGPCMGQRCAFIRLSRCNLRCGWCDTPETWDWNRFTAAEVSSKVPVAELVSWVLERDVDMVVLTGGEPMLQQNAMAAIARGLPDVRVQVETNGTMTPIPELVSLIDLWVVSPKLANSGMSYATRIKPMALKALAETGRAAFKFVVSDLDSELDEVAQLVDDNGLAPVWVMPEGSTREQVLTGMAELIGPVAKRGWNISSRLHILTGAQ